MRQEYSLFELYQGTCLFRSFFHSFRYPLSPFLAPSLFRIRIANANIFTGMRFVIGALADRASPLVEPPPQANVRCTPSAPAPARKRRRPNQDLQERLARCEELLKNYASAASADTPNSSVTGVSDEPPRDAPAFAEPPAWPPAGKVVVEDGSTRIVDSFVFTTLHEEV